MQANWSLILNILLLVGVVVAIGRLMKARRQSFNQPVQQAPVMGQPDQHRGFDDIIAVRKVVTNPLPAELTNEEPTVSATAVKTPSISLDMDELTIDPDAKNQAGKSVMMFLQAKENRQLAGYELLQSMLAAGLRFGEGHLFHRHQHANGQGPVMFSLAAATATGVFDLQNIGAFSVRGLCLYMQTSGNANIDMERFSIMLDTARQISEGLDTRLLDDKQKPLNEESIARYTRTLSASEQKTPVLI